MMVPTGEADLRMPELGSYIDPKIVNAAAELLRKYNLCAYNVPGDGSCMLHALKLCLAYQGVRCPSAEELRRIATRIAAEMWIKDPHGFGVHVAHSLKVNDSDEPFPNFEAYLAAASQPDCALGHVELHALAEHFKFCALVHSTESQEVITVGSNASVTIDVLHVNGNHYMALLPLQAPAKVTPVKDKPVKTSSKKNASKKTPFRHPCIAEPADIDDRLRRQEITHRKHCGVYNTFVGKRKPAKLNSGPAFKSQKERNKELRIKEALRVVEIKALKKARHLADMVALTQAVAENKKNSVQTAAVSPISPTIRRLPAGWQGRCLRPQCFDQPSTVNELYFFLVDIEDRVLTKDEVTIMLNRGCVEMNPGPEESLNPNALSAFVFNGDKNSVGGLSNSLEAIVRHPARPPPLVIALQEVTPAALRRHILSGYGIWPFLSKDALNLDSFVTTGGPAKTAVFYDLRYLRPKFEKKESFDVYRRTHESFARFMVENGCGQPDSLHDFNGMLSDVHLQGIAPKKKAAGAAHSLLSSSGSRGPSVQGAGGPHPVPGAPKKGPNVAVDPDLSGIEFCLASFHMPHKHTNEVKLKLLETILSFYIFYANTRGVQVLIGTDANYNLERIPGDLSDKFKNLLRKKAELQVIIPNREQKRRAGGQNDLIEGFFLITPTDPPLSRSVRSCLHFPEPAVAWSLSELAPGDTERYRGKHLPYSASFQIVPETKLLRQEKKAQALEIEDLKQRVANLEATPAAQAPIAALTALESELEEVRNELKESRNGNKDLKERMESFFSALAPFVAPNTGGQHDAPNEGNSDSTTPADEEKDIHSLGDDDSGAKSDGTGADGADAGEATSEEAPPAPQRGRGRPRNSETTRKKKRRADCRPRQRDPTRREEPNFFTNKLDKNPDYTMRDTAVTIAKNLNVRKQLNGGRYLDVGEVYAGLQRLFWVDDIHRNLHGYINEDDWDNCDYLDGALNIATYLVKTLKIVNATATAAAPAEEAIDLTREHDTVEQRVASVPAAPWAAGAPAAAQAPRKRPRCGGTYRDRAPPESESESESSDGDDDYEMSDDDSDS